MKIRADHSLGVVGPIELNVSNSPYLYEHGNVCLADKIPITASLGHAYVLVQVLCFDYLVCSVDRSVIFVSLVGLLISW